MSLLDNLPHRCRIQRRIQTNDSYGGAKHAPEVVQTDVECWEQQASASEINTYQKRGQSITTKVYFNSDPGIDEQYQIVITERNGVAVTSELVLDVKSTHEPDVSAGLGVLWRVMCERLSSEN